MTSPILDWRCQRLLERLDMFLEDIASKWRTEPGSKLKVMVLWRYNHVDPFRDSVPTFTNFEVSGQSFHRAKGLEADYTMLLDVSEGNYGVPSRIEDDELLNLVIPRPETFAYAEERRLFYVALTRASRGVFLVTGSRQPSRYIRELCEIAGDEVRFETTEGTALRQCPTCLVAHIVEKQNRDGSVFSGLTSILIAAGLNECQCGQRQGCEGGAEWDCSCRLARH
ncbi:3'-5' exonuclease [Ensifer adhaerens]|uniref:3'-5' exonuclease n=1 Tax=Ensifer adhaerens TaxID=106592 RepID=UPI001F253F91|nr:3'-5' exonuclease [Ensifer adhaerens]